MAVSGGRRDLIVLAVVLTLLSGAGTPIWGQQPSPKIWDIQLGTPVGDLPEEEFVDPACGTNGGPPGLRIGGFEDFSRCRPEPSGLREVWFRYDDELEFIARAARDPDAVARSSAMVVLGQPVSLSLLIDGGGRVQGYRIFTDPHADPDRRLDAYQLATAFQVPFGTAGWDCTDLPPAAGETPINGVFVKQHCRKMAEGQEIVVESRHYHKPGQAVLDPNTGQSTVNQFESSSRIQVVRSDAMRR